MNMKSKNENKDSAQSGHKMIKGQALDLADLVKFEKGSIVSRTLVEGKAGTITLFSFDEGESLSEHSAPFDAFVYLLEGALDLKLGAEHLPVQAGQSVLMPANVPHALHFPKPSKMLLVMIRG